MNSKLSSVPRKNKLWLVLVILGGWFSVDFFWPHDGTLKAEEWRTYASAIASAAASMVGLTVAVTAILYSLLGTPLLKFLHEKGALNRVLFDLVACALFWLIALSLGILGALPGYPHTEYVLRMATSAVAAGILCFIPIGWAFWILMKNSSVEIPPVPKHDFNSKTSL